MSEEGAKAAGRMNPTGHFKLPYPPCFGSAQQYDGWRRWARITALPCSPCSDCTARFRDEMRQAQRCDPAWVQTVFHMPPLKGRRPRKVPA